MMMMICVTRGQKIIHSIIYSFSSAIISAAASLKNSSEKVVAVLSTSIHRSNVN